MADLDHFARTISSATILNTPILLVGVITPINPQPVGVLVDYIEGAGISRADLDQYARTIFSKWTSQDPYRRQVGLYT